MDPIRAARVSMPPPAPSNHVSDHEEDPEDDEGDSEVDDPEILADLPDDTDVRRFPPTKAPNRRLLSHIRGFARVIRRSTSYTRG